MSVRQPFRRSAFVLSCITNSRQFNMNPWRIQDTMASVLHKSGFPRHRSKVPTHGEDGLLINCGFQETSTLLPSPCHHGYDGSTNLKSYEQTRRCRLHDLMGCWAKPVWYRVQAKNSNQSSRFSGFYCRIHSSRPWLEFIASLGPRRQK